MQQSGLSLLLFLCAAVWPPFIPCPPFIPFPVSPFHLESKMLGLKRYFIMLLGFPRHASLKDRSPELSAPFVTVGFPISMFCLCVHPPAFVCTPEMRWADQHPEFKLLSSQVHTWEYLVLPGLRGYSRNFVPTDTPRRKTRQHAPAFTKKKKRKFSEELSSRSFQLNELVYQIAILHRIPSFPCSIITNEFCFTSAPVILEQRFPVLWAAVPILVNASGHMWFGRDVVWILVSFLFSLPTFWNPSEEFRSITWILWNWFMNLTDFCSRRHPNSHTLVFLCNLQIYIGWPYKINITQRFFSRHVQSNFSVQHDDDEWNSFRASSSAQKFLLIPSSSLVCSVWNSSLSPWDCPLRFSPLTVDSRLGVGSWNS